MGQSVVINQPDDWHLHLRDGDYLTDTVAATAQHFARALVMPNLKPALTTLQSLRDYQNRIIAALPPQSQFQPYMTFYLNETVSPEDIISAKGLSTILGGKLYPAGATTNSEAGAASINLLYPLFDLMQSQDLVLQIHGEVTHGDIFDRESLFLEEVLSPIINKFPRLRIVLEHISTKAAVDFIINAPAHVAATITPHHLYYNRNHLLAGGIKPHFFCFPILKREHDQQALIKAAISGNPKFFAGTDSAPHSRHTKESACGCAGIYSAPYAMAVYTEVFAQDGHLDRLNAFTSQFGADFYKLPVNQKQIELRSIPQIVPAKLKFGSDWVIPIAAGQTLQWSVHEAS